MIRETKVQQALEECLEALDLHATVEDCLARHPAESEALRPYLELRSRLRAREVPTAPYAAYKTGRDRMLASITGNRSSRPGNRPVPGWLRSPFGRATATAALLLLLVGGTISASAAAGVGASKSMISTALRIAAPQSHNSTPAPTQDVSEAPLNESGAVDPQSAADDSGRSTSNQDLADGSDPAATEGAVDPPAQPAVVPIDEPDPADSTVSARPGDDRDGPGDDAEGHEDEGGSVVITPGHDQQPIVNSDDSHDTDDRDHDDQDDHHGDRNDSDGNRDASDSNQGNGPEDGQEDAQNEKDGSSDNDGHHHERDEQNTHDTDESESG